MEPSAWKEAKGSGEERERGEEWEGKINKTVFV